MAIAAGMTTLTVTWDSPATDTAYTYAVRIFSDKGVTTFASANAANWTNLPWNNDPATTGLTYVSQPTVGQKQYSYTTPTLTPGIATGGWLPDLPGCGRNAAFFRMQAHRFESQTQRCQAAQLDLPVRRLLPC